MPTMSLRSSAMSAISSAKTDGPGLGAAGLGGFAGLRVDDPDGVELVGFMGAGGRVAVALLGHGVHDHGTGVVLGRGQRVLHGLEVVAVHGADVLHAEVLEHALRCPPVLDALLHGVQAAVGELARGSAVLQPPPPPVQGAFVGGRGAEGIDGGAQRGEVVRESAHGGGVGAAVVVHDDHDAALLVRGDVVDGLPGHAAGEGAVAHDGDDVPVAVAGQLPGAGDAVRPGERGGGVRAFDDVVLGFGAVRVAGQAALLAQGAEVLASGEELVHVGLVAGVEDDAVAGGIEDPVDRDGEFDDAEVRAQVPARLGDVADQEFPDLGCQLIQLRLGQLAQVLRIPDGLQDSQRPLLRVVDMPFNSNASGGSRCGTGTRPRHAGEGPGPVSDRPGLPRWPLLAGLR